jgi:phosphohistidine phosphatase
MMANTKQLFIVRHGKADHEYDVDDIDRLLKERGIHDSHKMADRLKKKEILPEVFISSPAPRALHTGLIFARNLGYPVANMRLSDIIYDGGAHEILNFIKKMDNAFSSIIVFGHNPMSTDLANFFLKEKLDKLPTAGIAAITFESDSWENISAENVVKEEVDYPKK